MLLSTTGLLEETLREVPNSISIGASLQTVTEWIDLAMITIVWRGRGVCVDICQPEVLEIIAFHESFGHSTLEILFAGRPAGRGGTGIVLEAGHVLQHFISAFTVVVERKRASLWRGSLKPDVDGWWTSK